jgi:hypothetical protein
MNGFWKRKYGSGDAHRRTISLNGENYEVVGACRPPSDFFSRQADLFMPVVFQRSSSPTTVA